MIKAVLFDLDNTLIDFMRMKQVSSEAAVRSMIDAGLGIGEKQGLRKLYEMYEDQGIEDQKIFDKFVKQVHGEIDYKILAAGIAAYRKVKVGQLTPYPHARSVLIRLRELGLKLGIVSDAPVKQAWLRLAELNLMEFFDFVVAVGMTGKEKPHKMPFMRAIEKLGISPEEVLFVGDNPKRDILGAKRSGMKTALAKYGQVVSSKEIRADFELRGLNDLIKIVEKDN